MAVETENPIPKEWRDRGYSGRVTVMVAVNDQTTGGPASPEQLAGLRAAVPYEPYGPGGGYLALAVEDVAGAPHVVMIRRDDTYVADSYVRTTPPFGRPGS